MNCPRPYRPETPFFEPFFGLWGSGHQRAPSTFRIEVLIRFCLTTTTDCRNSKFAVETSRFLRGAKRGQKAYNTWGSHVVTHHSTNQARQCLTSEIGRDPVFSMRYGRKQSYCFRETQGPNQGAGPGGTV